MGIERKKHFAKRIKKEGYENTFLPIDTNGAMQNVFWPAPNTTQTVLYKNNRFATLLQGNLKFHFIYHNKNTFY